MLFGPSRALHITLEAIRQHPQLAEGICVGMIAAVDAYDAQLVRGLDDTAPALEPPTDPPKENDGAKRRVGALSRSS